MDVNVKALMEAANCSETEAQAALDSAGQDIRKAMEMLEQRDERKATVFNVYFEAQSATKAKGFASAVVDDAAGTLIYGDLVYPLTDKQALELDIHMPPTIYLPAIRRSQTALGDRLQENCAVHAGNWRSQLGSNITRSLISNRDATRVDAVNRDLKEALDKALGEPVTPKFHVLSHPLKDAKEFTAGLQSQARESGEGDGQRGNDKAQGPPSHPVTGEIPRIVLNVEPEISPFLGRPARELHMGEEIVVKVKDVRDAARYFAELLGGVVGEEAVPLIVPVISSERISGDCHKVAVEFGSGIWGEFVVPSHTRLKTRSEELEIYRPFEEDISIFSERKFYNQFMMSVGVILIALAGLVVFFAYTP